MKIPILVSGNPTSLVNGTTCEVYLGHGQWGFEVENLVDSKFSLVNDKVTMIYEDGTLVDGPCFLFASFNQIGSENNLNIYAIPHPEL